jgi:hypothetical protein
MHQLHYHIASVSLFFRSIAYALYSIINEYLRVVFRFRNRMALDFLPLAKNRAVIIGVAMTRDRNLLCSNGNMAPTLSQSRAFQLSFENIRWKY